MSYSEAMPKTPSLELIALCQAQIQLLTRTLKADWGAVYLTESVADDAQTHLIPVVVYPQTSPFPDKIEHFKELSEVEEINSSSEPFLMAEITDRPSTHSEIDTIHSLWDANTQKNNRLILPLIHEEQMMGLLVTGRKKRQWNRQELVQIEKITKTLAIACLLDRKQQWSEQQLQGQQLRQSLERERLDNFLHQLRNPLTALKTFSKLLLKRLSPDERQQSAIKGILRESDRLQDLMAEFEAENEQLATRTTVEVDDAPQLRGNSPFLLPGTALILEPVTVTDILDPLLLSAQTIAQLKQITLTSHYPANLPPVQANTKALREVLSNLIDNALKYTPSKGQVSVTVEWDVTQPEISISIGDTGYGIPLEDREHLFERYYRGVQAKGNIPGTGLGLAIVKDLVGQMQGHIELVSPNPQSKTAAFPGTVFIVWLPVAG